MTDILRVKFGETHIATHIEDAGEKQFVTTMCGATQEVNEQNSHRVKIIRDTDVLSSCPTCKYRMLEELSADLLNPDRETDSCDQGDGSQGRGPA